MFIYKIEESKDDGILLGIKELFGVVPPQWKLLAQIHPKRFKMFMEEISHLVHHPHIEPDFFAFVRLYVANKEGFFYCKSFNTKLLLASGYGKSVLQAYKKDFSCLPLDGQHQALFHAVMKALYDAENFTENDIKTLHTFGWDDEDIYDAIDHGAFLFKFSHILKAYIAKDVS